MVAATIEDIGNANAALKKIMDDKENSIKDIIGAVQTELKQAMDKLDERITGVADEETKRQSKYESFHAQVQGIHIGIQSRIQTLEAKEVKKADPKDLTDTKAFTKLPFYAGTESEFHDFEFKLLRYLRQHPGFEEYLEWAKRREEPITKEAANTQTTNMDGGVDYVWLDEQVYNILCMLCTNSSLTLVKNQMKHGTEGIRGACAWYELTRDFARRSGARLDSLTDLAVHPKKIKSYAEARTRLAQWEADKEELEKLEQRSLTDLTLRQAIKRMMPEDMQHDIEKDTNLSTFASVYKYIVAQIPIRKEREEAGKPSKGKNGEANSLDDKEELGKEDESFDHNDDHDLNIMKGAGKGGFQGHCNYCWKYGHKKADCRELSSKIQQNKGTAKGEDKGKGKGKDGGFTDYRGQKGYAGNGWSYKGNFYGWKGRGKGSYQQYGSGKGGYRPLYTNIDGDSSEYNGYESNYHAGVGGRFFMLHEEEEEEDAKSMEDGGSSSDETRCCTDDLSEELDLPSADEICGVCGPDFGEELLDMKSFPELLAEPKLQSKKKMTKFDKPKKERKKRRGGKKSRRLTTTGITNAQSGAADVEPSEAAHLPSGSRWRVPPDEIAYSKREGNPTGGVQKAEKKWYDELCPLYEDEEEENDQFLGSWKAEPVGGWVKVENVMDSGASAPVGPTNMAPNAPMRASPGSLRGQTYTTASKHKLANLGEQLLNATTEDGDQTQVLYQIADVSRPLVSVSAICEMGNRVIFGKGGGVVQNISTGKETPFYRKNGIYVLNLWLQDSTEPGFTRR